MSSDKEFPRVLFLLDHIIKQKPHDTVVGIIKDDEGYIHPTQDIEYLSLAEHAATISELKRENERLAKELAFSYQNHLHTLSIHPSFRNTVETCAIHDAIARLRYKREALAKTEG